MDVISKNSYGSKKKNVNTVKGYKEREVVESQRRDGTRDIKLEGR